MCSKHREPGHHLCLPRTVIRAAARDPPPNPVPQGHLPWGGGQGEMVYHLFFMSFLDTTSI